MGERGDVRIMASFVINLPISSNSEIGVLESERFKCEISCEVLGK